MSVVGFEDIFGSDFCHPPLTTVSAPVELGITSRTQLQTALTEDCRPAGTSASAGGQQHESARMMLAGLGRLPGGFQAGAKLGRRTDRSMWMVAAV